MSASITKQIEISAQNILSVVEDLSLATLTKKPAPDKWSIAEIIEHLTLVDRGILQIMLDAMALPPQPVALYKKLIPFEHVVPLRPVKVEAPKQVRPKGVVATDKQALFASYRAARSNILDFFIQHEEKLTSITPLHPILGYITGAIAQRVILGHDRRHLKQIKDLLS